MIRRLVLAGRLFLAAASTMAADPGIPAPLGGDLRSDLAARVGAWARSPTPGATSSSPGALGLDEVTTAFLARSPGLADLLADVGLAGAELRQDLLPSNPSLEAELRSPRGEEGNELELAWTQDLTRPIFRRRRRAVARARLDAARARTLAQALRDLAEVRRSFHRALAAERILQLRGIVVDAFEASTELATRMHQAGTLNDLAYGIERNLLESARLDVTAAEAEHLVARQRLNALAGLAPDDASTPLTGPETVPPDLGPDPDLAQVRAASLDLAALDAELHQARASRSLVRAEGRLPRLGLGIVGERAHDGTWDLGPHLVLGLPLFDRGQARLDQAALTLGRLEARRARMLQLLDAETRAVAARSRGTHRQATHLAATVIPLRRNLVDTGQLRFNAMALGAFALLQLRRDEIAAGVRYVEALRDHGEARTDLETLLAGALPSPSPDPGARTGSGLADRAGSDEH